MNMIDFRPFNRYKDFITSQIDLKQGEQAEDSSSRVLKYDLKSQIFLFRDGSVRDDILKGNSSSTKHYKFNWKIIKNVEKDVYLLNLKIVSHFGTYIISNFYFIISKENRFILVIGYLSSENLKRIEAFLESFFPKVSHSFLNQNEIKKLIFDFTKEKKYRLEYKMIIYSKKAIDGKTPRKAVDYILGDLKTKIFELENELKFIDTIELQVSEIESKDQFHFRYNRVNKLTWNNGKAEEFIILLDSIYKIIIVKFDYLDKRDRINTEDNITKPFILKFRNPIFSTKEKVSLFVDSFKDFPKCTYAIIHSGNPYLHLMMRDIKDNSTYTLKTISYRDLIVSPQILSSNSSLIRILDFISNNIFEYEILDYDDYLNAIQRDGEN